MNKRITKKKEKQSLMAYSFELIPCYSFKERKKLINQLWKMYHDAGYKMSIGYKKIILEFMISKEKMDSI